MSTVFPFSAIIGQSQLKLALKLVVINPSLNGLLISGDKGTAKSTSARSLASIMNFPLVNLPMGTTEDRLVGSLDIQKMLESHQLGFSPGLLAKAHSGALYIDEVNLLSDRLVDILLDVSASGVNYVERDGLSHSHEAEFFLLGSMNPDEGELREQFKDRFGLHVHVETPKTAEDRVKIVQQRHLFEKDPVRFAASFEAHDESLQQTLLQARSRLNEVEISQELELHIAQECIKSNVEGLRADIFWQSAAKAHASLYGRSKVSTIDIESVSEFVLSHRRKRLSPDSIDPPSQKNYKRPPSSAQNNNKTQSNELNIESRVQTSSFKSMNDLSAVSAYQGVNGVSQSWSKDSLDENLSDRFFLLLHPVFSKKNSFKKAISSSYPSELTRLSSFKRLGIKGGKYSVDTGQFSGDINRSKINWQKSVVNYHRSLINEESEKTSLADALLFKPNDRRSPPINLVLVDTSASTMARNGHNIIRRILYSINYHCYLNREKIAILSFGQQTVHWLQRLSKSYKTLQARLPSIRFGGGTALEEALQISRSFIKQNIATNPVIRTFLVTDGRYQNFAISRLSNTECWVVDAELARVPLGRCRILASQLQANYIKIPC